MQTGTPACTSVAWSSPAWSSTRAVKLQDLLTQVSPSGSEEALGALTATVKEAVVSMSQGQILQAAEGIADHVRSAILAQLSKHWRAKLTADPASFPLPYPAQTPVRILDNSCPTNVLVLSRTTPVRILDCTCPTNVLVLSSTAPCASLTTHGSPTSWC